MRRSRAPVSCRRRRLPRRTPKRMPRSKNLRDQSPNCRPRSTPAASRLPRTVISSSLISRCSTCTAALEKAKAALTAAQMEEAELSASVRASKQQTDEAYSRREGVKAKAANLAADTTRLSALQAQLPEKKSQTEQLLAVWQHIPVPEAPRDDSASATVVEIRACNGFFFRRSATPCSPPVFWPSGAFRTAVITMLTQPGMAFDDPEELEGCACRCSRIAGLPRAAKLRLGREPLPNRCADKL